jgi:stage II sporulation protein AA (anti-sigma F factor antagonist)
MKTEFLKEKKQLFIFLNGEIDHSKAREIIVFTDSEIDVYRPNKLILDFKNVSFADSSAIAVVIGRCNKMKMLGKEPKVKIQNATPTIMKIFSFSGLENYIER